MQGNKEIIEHMKKDSVKNCNILGFIKNYPPEYLIKFKNSVYTKAKSDYNWIYISCNSAGELKEILAKMQPDETHFAIVDDWMMPCFLEKYKINWQLTTIKLYLPENVNIPETNNVLQPLRENDANYIYENSHYKEFTNIEYIKERIRNGISGVLRINGELAGWSLTHDDDAIGFLYVMEKFRKKGFAADILNYMIAKVRNAGILPFVHIEETNSISLKLAANAGFINYGKIHWFEVFS